jgi:hypothetical protein
MRRLVILSLMLSMGTAAWGEGVTVTDGRVAITAYSYTAGAVCSLRWNGREFIDALDHGRCLQSASSFDGLGEAHNPTEAGNYPDGYLPRPSTSRLMNWAAGNGRLATAIDMAYWQGGVSGHVHRKYVGFSGNLIDWRVEFELPRNANYGIGQFEVLTGYMPSNFRNFYVLKEGTLQTVSDGPGEQQYPLVFCTADHLACMGVWSLDTQGGGFGRWRFVDCVKWNVVTRVSYPKGTYRFRVWLAVGTAKEVVQALEQLRAL